ncbi:Exon junction complex, Pym [Pseudocohnilembus persalinus]|uniref:Exon junction complex, Pym n=1 Tax=Pseudocohnilembus persalinus TaxID=266149 RepID=A0A0V0QQF3_PSEPJ|nr:Exon junction complex, Pym [Pseudocohnilembus persalinus]|eukprot:KRX04359.1 Exon junction complex, Pym [Pseudocohnilembus persalinus]
MADTDSKNIQKNTNIQNDPIPFSKTEAVVIQGTLRKDGTKRKDIKIRPGYMNPEQKLVYTYKIPQRRSEQDTQKINQINRNTQECDQYQKNNSYNSQNDKNVNEIPEKINKNQHSNCKEQNQIDISNKSYIKKQFKDIQIYDKNDKQDKNLSQNNFNGLRNKHYNNSNNIDNNSYNNKNQKYLRNSEENYNMDNRLQKQSNQYNNSNNIGQPNFYSGEKNNEEEFPALGQEIDINQKQEDDLSNNLFY